MSNVVKGLVAGLVATLVLSVVMVINTTNGLMPQVNIIGLLTALGTLTVASAWMDHFIVGVVVWGLLFAGWDGVAARPAPWLKGLLFGVFAWLMMLLLVMPLAGAGLFGAKLDLATRAGLLGLHLIYGAVLGVTYGLLAFVPVRVPVLLPKGEVAAGPDGSTMSSADINDHLPSSSPSGLTVAIIIGSVIGFFGLMVLIVELRAMFGI